MLGNCPNKNSDEWRRLLAQENGNEERALEEWHRLNEENDDSDFETPIEDDPDLTEDAEPEEFTEKVQKIRVFLEEQRYELSRKKVKNQKAQQAKINRLIKEIKELEAVESINLFVDDVFDKALTYKKEFNDLLVQHREGKITNKDFLEGLVMMNEFANGYSILDEIAEDEVDEYFSTPVERKNFSDYTPQDKIKEAINIRKFLKLAFTKEVPDLLAESLINYRTYTNRESIVDQIKTYEQRIADIRASNLSDKTKLKDIAEAKKELTKWQNMLLDKQKLAGILRMASKDESVFDFLLNPLISSEDSAMALFAKMIKSQFQGAQMEDIMERDEGVAKLEEFIAKTGRSVNNVAELNKGLYEEISVLRRDYRGKAVKIDGELVFDKRMSFVQKFDLNAYGQAESQFYKDNPKPRLAEDPTPEQTAEHEIALKEWRSKRRKWYQANRQPKSQEEIQKIQKAKKADVDAGIITAEEYDEWLKKVEYEDKKTGKKVFYGELTEPSNKYLNEAWLKLYDKEGNPISPEGEYHKYLTDTYLRDQEDIPEAQRMGYFLPSIPMEDYERAFRKGAGNLIKKNTVEAFKIQSYEQDIYGTSLGEGDDLDTRPFGRNSLTGQVILPVYFTQPIDVNDVSVDLLGSVLKYGAASRRYEAMNEVYAEINAFKTIIGERETSAVNSAGESIFNIAAKKVGFDQYLKNTGTSYSKMHVDAFIDMVVKGESQKAEKLIGLEMSKIANTGMAISAITTLSMDVLKGTANNIQGNIQVAIEAAGGEYFNRKNLRKGFTKYWATVGDNIADFGRRKPESWMGQLIDIYDPIQGTFKDEYGKNVSANMANKFFRTNTMFFNNNFAEHEIQVKTLFALMDAKKVIDKETGEEITLLQAHEKYGPQLFEVTKDENGKRVYNYKIEVDVTNLDGTVERKDFDERERQNFMNVLHALNKRMHGVYNDFDKSTAQRFALGRLLLMYRKHLVPGIKRRCKSASYDEELGGATEGMYRVFWRTLIKDTIRYKTDIFKKWSTYSTFEKAQIRKVVAELTIIAALATLIIVLSAMAGGDDGEEKKEMPYAYHFMLYQALRMRSETASYLKPSDFWRVVKSPTAMTSVVDRFTKFTDQFLFTWDEDDLVFKKKSGVWDKGDNKSWAYFLKLMGFTGYNLTPDKAVEGFKSTFAK
jgi:hypothetical protein